MKFIHILMILGVTQSAVLERRKSFVETHQEHGHLPGGKNNPGFGAIIQQAMSILGGNVNVLDDYNKAADQKEGRTTVAEGKSQGGLASQLGFGDLLGGII